MYRRSFFILFFIFISGIATYETAAQNPKFQDIKQIAHWNGGFSITGEYSNYQPFSQSIPPSYLQLSSSQNITVSGLPINGYLFLSSYNQKTLNQFSVSIDPQTLQENIKSRVEKNISNMELNPGITAFDQKIKERYDNENVYKELTRINSQIEAEKPIDKEELEKFSSIIKSQEQLKKYNPDNYKSFVEYSKLKSLTGRTDYQRNLKWLYSNNIINSYEKMWYNFNAFELGTTHPNFSPLTLEGIPVNGYYFSYSNRYLFLASANGQTIPFSSSTPNPGYSRALKAYKFGAGQEDMTHIHFTYLNAKDQVLNNSNPAKANSVAGIDGRFQLYKNKISVGGGAYSDLFTSDIKNTGEEDAIDLENSIPNKAVSNWVSKEVAFNKTTTNQYAYIFDIDYKNSKNTHFYGNIRHIQPGYQSLGLAYLQQDIRRVEMLGEGGIMHGRIKASGRLRIDRDNLNHFKKLTTQNFNGLLGLKSEFEGIPSLSLTYMPNVYRSGLNSEIPSFIHQQHLVNILASHAYLALKLPMKTSVSITISQYTTGLSRFGTGITMLNHFIMVSAKWTGNLQAEYRQTGNYRYGSTQPMVQYRFSKKNLAYLAFRYGTDHLRNRKSAVNGGIIIQFFNNLSWELAVKQNYYLKTNTINDLRIHTTLRVVW